MPGIVHFIDLRTNFKENLLEKLARLMSEAGISETVAERDLVAVKLHFGESGTTAYVRPVFLRKIVEVIKAVGGVPFLTDSNTLYAGTRSDTPRHLETAIHNGFAYSVVGAPLVIADGLRGKSDRIVNIDGTRFTRVCIASEIAEADSLVSVAHFKGHELTGFGGTLKNLGMGCASRRGKLEQHSTLSPKVKRRKCIGCGQCVPHCAQGAIRLTEERAAIDSERCIGCGECILICSRGAIQVRWNQSIPVFMENMIEYAMGVLKHKQGRCLFVNFITDVSPACDCIRHSDAPVVRNIGILASRDPVAIDQASVDLVNKEQALPGCAVTANAGCGEDKFGGLYPNVDWALQLEYAERLGLGSRTYELIRLGGVMDHA